MLNSEYTPPHPHKAAHDQAQADYADARIAKRLDPELGAWLRMHLREIFTKSQSWDELKFKLHHRGFFLKRGDGHLWLRDCHSRLHICSCSYLGHPASKLENKFGMRFH